jgi:hypothetical protein
MKTTSIYSLLNENNWQNLNITKFYNETSENDVSENDDCNIYTFYVEMNSKKLQQKHDILIEDAVILAKAYWENVYCAMPEDNWNKKVKDEIKNIENNPKHSQFLRYLEVELHNNNLYNFHTLALEEAYAIAKGRWQILENNNFTL